MISMSSSLFLVVACLALANVPTALAWAGHNNKSLKDPISTRREAFFGACAMGLLVGGTACATPASADTGAEVRGIGVTPFNSLMFQYRSSESDTGGIKASDLDEPSISYDDFVAKLKGGDVEFVEFFAPDGDVAYARIKGGEKPIRIGEGYPIEQHDGWSSPAFAVRTVKNYGVPYKFIVPALSSYKTS